MIKPKYKPIVILTHGKPTEIVQRLAFSFDYRWTSGVPPYSLTGSDVRPTEKFDWVMFDPNDYTINAGFNINVFDKQNIFINSLDEFLTALKTPSLAIETIDFIDGKHSASIFENNVTFRSTTSKLVGTVTVPKAFLQEVIKKTGMTDEKKNRLPKVMFNYHGYKRIVNVVSMDATYLKGIEMEKGSVKVTDPILKTYRIDEMSNGGVELVAY